MLWTKRTFSNLQRSFGSVGNVMVVIAIDEYEATRAQKHSEICTQ